MEQHHLARDQYSKAYDHQEVVTFFEQAIHVFLGNWKRLIIGALFGLFFGLGYWFFAAPYKADLILSNKFANANTNTNTNNAKFDLIIWKQLLKKLPNLAVKVFANGEHGSESDNLSSPKWWSKNVTPIYAISKSDIKDLSVNQKDLDVGNTLLGLSIAASGPTADVASSSALMAAQFIRSGGSYLAIQSLLGEYELMLNQDYSKIDGRIINLQIEAENLRKQAVTLENFRKQFPQSVNIGALTIEAKNGGAKYLPLTTQLVAVNADLASNQEELIMLSNMKEELVLLGQFMAKAKEIVGSDLNGLDLVRKLLTVELDIEKKITNPSLYQRRILGQIKLDLASIDTRYGVGLVVNYQSTASRPGVWLFAFGGLMCGAILAVLTLLSQGFWRNHLLSHSNQ